ncbi:MAG: flagellar hook-basal body complex protein [Planctomycetes bacterium]|jgi:flagellar hook protein FlgE|nr:flagellar hook-basal body complex protein [Planctomycetota bacterium]
MGLSTSLFTALTGLDSSGTYMDVIGNNIANVNTAAFKKSRITFEAQFARTLANGSAPSAELGGTNPLQVGLGTRVSAIRRDYANGPIEPTGVNTDMAIDGPGFFIVEDAGVQRYTRKGDFSIDSDFNLVSTTGARVQGYGVDDDFNVVEGVLTDTFIPIGVQTVAQATEEVRFAGNLNAGGDIATQGSINQLDPLFSDAAATVPAAAGDALDSIYDATGGTPLFAIGDVITFTGATKGGATVGDATFEVGAANTTGSDAFGTTLQELMDFIEDSLGIDNTLGPAGISIDGAGVISIAGNVGTVNDIVIEPGDFVVNQGGASPDTPFNFTQTQAADGESTRTTFVAFNSLGDPISIDLSMVLTSSDNTGTQWSYFATSVDDTDADRLLGTGTLDFDVNGQIASTAPVNLTIDLADTGAQTPQDVSLTFADPQGTLTALVDTNSEFSAITQDGAAIGTLEDFSVEADGTISGIFSNGLIRTLGRLPLATFANEEGLQEIGGSLFQQTPGSGAAIVVSAASGAAGKVVGRSLEGSNVELANEFVNLINASTGFSANSRVISTADRLIQELLASVR